jgi:uncharacterized protein YndB with AHSA1/START domain
VLERLLRPRSRKEFEVFGHSLDGTAKAPPPHQANACDSHARPRSRTPTIATARRCAVQNAIGSRDGAQPGELRLEIEHLFPAARAIVFRAFSDPDVLAKWWGPEGFTTPSLEFSPCVGASYRIEMQPPEGDPFHLTGVFREVDPPARLAYTFAWEPPDPDDVETLVELSFRDLGESTEVVLNQGLFKTEARRELHRNGWTESLQKLEQFI